MWTPEDAADEKRNGDFGTDAMIEIAVILIKMSICIQHP
jgi:hypothetical protein